MKPALLSGIIVLAVAGLFGYKVFSEDQREAQRIREQLQQASHLEQQRSQLGASVEEVEAYRRRLAPEGEVAWLVQAVGELAREAGVRLATINPKRPRAFGELTQLSVALHLSASYHQLGQLLSRIESAEHFLHVDELDFTLMRQEEGGIAGVDLLISTFHVPPVKL